jgi:hypothetical protein
VSGPNDAVDNNMTSRVFINSTSNCLKKLRLDFTNYAAFLGGSPIVKTASFVAACTNSSCYLKVTVGENSDPTLNTQCGPIFTGCDSVTMCYRRANCDLQGKYISIISDGW